MGGCLSLVTVVAHLLHAPIKGGEEGKIQAGITRGFRRASSGRLIGQMEVVDLLLDCGEVLPEGMPLCDDRRELVEGWVGDGFQGAIHVYNHLARRVDGASPNLIQEFDEGPSCSA